jgi:hypothetical protein
MKSLLILFTAALLFGCAPALTVSTFAPESNNYPACKYPVYVATMSKETKNSGLDLTVYNLLREAQGRYGADATVQNIRWDKNGNKRVSAIFDVIKCNTDTLNK